MDNYITSIGSRRKQHTTGRLTNMELSNFLLSLLLLVLPAAAQFQFFDQFFQGGGGGGPQQAQPQNAGSDSAWYQQHYEAGKPRLDLSSAAV